jgi:hypothetical protein
MRRAMKAPQVTMNGREERQATRTTARRPTHDDARQAAADLIALALAGRRHGRASLEMSFHDGQLQTIREQTDFVRA